MHCASLTPLPTPHANPGVRNQSWPPSHQPTSVDDGHVAVHGVPRPVNHQRQVGAGQHGVNNLLKGWARRWGGVVGRAGDWVVGWGGVGWLGGGDWAGEVGGVWAQSRAAASSGRSSHVPPLPSGFPVASRPLPQHRAQTKGQARTCLLAKVDTYCVLSEGSWVTIRCEWRLQRAPAATGSPGREVEGGGAGAGGRGPAGSAETTLGAAARTRYRRTLGAPPC